MAGLIRMCGLLQPNCENLVDYAMQVHRERDRGEPAFRRAGRFRRYFPRQWSNSTGDGCIHFVGVWDTVKSVGLLSRSLVLPYTANMAAAAHGRHAVSLNERRSKYRPNLWNPKRAEEIDEETGLPCFVQAWFPGVHSDVGGGYEDTGLSDISLEWMLGEAAAFGLLLKKDKHTRELTPDSLGRMHNPLWPFWWVLGWWRRRAPVSGSVVHASVNERRSADGKFDRFCARVLPAGMRNVGTSRPQVEG